MSIDAVTTSQLSRALALPALADPGLVYRRDAIDRPHVGEPHQVDIWRATRAAMAGTCARPSAPPNGGAARSTTHADLQALVAIVVGAALPGRRWRTQPASHPYTID